MRAVFDKPSDRDYCLVQLPDEAFEARSSGQVRAFAKDRELPVRTVMDADALVHVLVNCSTIGNDQTVTVYAVTNGPPLAETGAFRDPLPVSVRLQRAGAFEAPPSWEEMRFMATRSLHDAVHFRMERPQPQKSQEKGPRNWYQKSWKRPTYIARLSGMLWVPETGRYVLAVDSRQPTYLLIENRLVLTAGTEKTHDWETSAPLELRAGPVAYEFMHLCRDEIDFRAGWQPPGTDAIAPLPDQALLTGAGPVPVRIEHIGAVLHAGADCRLEPGYRFLGCSSVFTPARLRSMHVAWEGAGQVRCRWMDGDRLLNTEPAWRHIFNTTGNQTIQLMVENAAGARETAALTVTIPEDVPTEYRLATRLQGVSPICYDDDPLHPEIQLRGTVPPDLPLDLVIFITAPDGSERRLHRTVRLEKGGGRVLLPDGNVRAYRSIRWQVLHAGAVIDQGAADFMRPPFDRLPSSLNGALLMDEETVCILVPRRASSGHPPPFGGLRRGDRVVLLDGFLEPDDAADDDANNLLEDRLAAELRTFGGQTTTADWLTGGFLRVDQTTLGAAHWLHGLARLAPLAALSELLPADVAIVAPAMRGAGQGESLEDFERQLSATAGLLRDAAGCEVLLVTPPPGLRPPGLTTPSDARDPMRAYAEAVVRVADAYGLTVVDFYTMCHTRSATIPVIDGRISAAGRDLAIETLARTLVGNPPRWRID